jgi:hypothetical protein
MAHGVALARDVAEGATLTEDDLAPWPYAAQENVAMRAELQQLLRR